MAFRFLLLTLLLLAQTRSIAQSASSAPLTHAARTLAPHSSDSATQPAPATPNRIDSLNTIYDVIRFVHHLGQDYSLAEAQPYLRSDTITAYKRLIHRFHIQPFEKIDIDGNGFTDLLFNGRLPHRPGDQEKPISIVVLSFGKDSFLVKDLLLYTNSQYFAARVLHIDGKPAIQTLHTLWHEKGPKYWNDTLAWRLNTFIEKNIPVKRIIERIDYEADFVDMYSPNLLIRITGDTVRLLTPMWDGPSHIDNADPFVAVLDPVTKARIFGLLEQMDFVRMKDQYQVHYSCAGTGILHITYDGGREKKIYLYGFQGSYGLAELHDLFFNLQKTQHWLDKNAVVPNRIDSLHTSDEVLSFVQHLPRHWSSYKAFFFEPAASTYPSVTHRNREWRRRLDSFGVGRYEKVDLDNNGFTDLLFNGYDSVNQQICSLLVLSYANDSFRVMPLPKESSSKFFAARLTHLDGKTFLQTLTEINDKETRDRYDTLQWFDRWLIDKSSYVPRKIDTLRYEFIRSMSGEDWELTIFGDSCLLKVPTDSGKLYAARMADTTSESLYSLLNFIDFERWKQGYKECCFDRNIGYFEIKYNGGKTKHVLKVGDAGPYALGALEKMLLDLVKARHWQQMPPR
jgi:hypothetical protein